MSTPNGNNANSRNGNSQVNDYFYPFRGINPFDPPDMKTFVYSPGVRILIARGSKQYDVSRDIIRGTIIRKENSASTLAFELANRGDYNGLFHRMDRVVVFLKRVRWQQVFSGYLDTVPFAQLYGGSAEYKATCTLKRLLHTWWTPGLAASQPLFDQTIWGLNPGADGVLPTDSGLGGMLRNLLSQVGGWQPADIHIQKFPMVFYAFLQSQLLSKRNANQKQAQNFKRLLLGTAYNQYAPGEYAGWNNSAGSPGPQGFGEPFYIAQIVAAADNMGLGPKIPDITHSQQILEAAATGEGTRDDAVRGAFAQVGEAEAARNQQERVSDAAILGVAAAMVESGAGVTILNQFNPSVPDSVKFLPNDGPTFNNDALGIFHQRSVGWGTVAQRMDPRQAATMFFDKLPPDWRYLPPAEAIARVQQSGPAERYAAAVPLATTKVQAYRKAQEGVSSTVAATPLGTAATAVGATVGLNPAAVISSATSSLNPADIATALGRPRGDTEAAVAEALSKIGSPYAWGTEGPSTFDCSGLVRWAYRAAGIRIEGNTETMHATLPRVDPSQARRGDIIICNGTAHVVIYLGAGMCVEAQGTGETTTVTNPVPGEMVTVNPAPEVWTSVHRVGENSGIPGNLSPDPTVVRLNPAISGPGTPVGTGTQSQTGANGGQVSEPVAQNLFAYFFTPDRFLSPIADMFYMDHKDFMESEPLMQMVQNVSRASLRNFASAPDGSFMAYYPDYFGLDGKKAIVRLEDIELKDVKINFSDDNLTTHVYVAGDVMSQMGEPPTPLAWLESAGSVTVEHEWLFERLRMIAPGDLGGASGPDLMRRFGVRPLKVPVAMAGKEELEFLLATQIFMEKWAQQYQTRCQFTFLPELFPGMRVILSGHDLQVYVSEVVHNFDWENGFSTEAVIMAPSRTDATSAMAAAGGFFLPDDTNIGRGLGFNADGTTSSEVVPG